MKKTPPSKRNNTPPTPPRHEFAEAAPTVIHHPEEDMTALARVVQRVVETQGKRIGPILAAAVGLAAAVVLWNAASSGRSGDAQVWARIESARKSDDLITLAKENAGTPAATWALYRAAGELYNEGLMDMPNNQDVARPLFRRALDLFEQVVKETKSDSPLHRAAALGKARAYEARNELSKAIEEYNLVAKTWPGTPEAEEAAARSRILDQPESAVFYKELAAYSPARVTLPSEPGSSTAIPGLPGGLPSIPPPSSTIELPASSTTNVRVEPAPAPMPTPRVEPASPATPKTPTPAPAAKSDAPKTGTTPAPAAKPDAPRAGTTPAPAAKPDAPRAGRTPAPAAKPAADLPKNVLAPQSKPAAPR